ncbi:PREDICTED: uncharacterized protein LOC109227713 [Nicotiana attenuata]|nr:PREDICTED: uncharacterized protein LOC109227713 [Nicotiana attenuata]
MLMCFVVVDDGNCSKEGEIPMNSGYEENGNYGFLLINPKDVDAKTKSLLQEVLRIYSKELPAMNSAANTGKESQFLERCVSNGKYCMLVLKTKDDIEPGEVVRIEKSGVMRKLAKQTLSDDKSYNKREVIAAMTYQIVPADMQIAEVPLASVKSVYQLKGFSVIGQVDTKGRARRLPVKADIQKALCFPGGSYLMISHFNKDNLHDSAVYLSLKFPLKPSGEDCQSPVLQEQRETVSDGNDHSHNVLVLRDGHLKSVQNCRSTCKAWILSPSWLKESVRTGKFIDEMPFNLRDEDYELKYKTKLKGAVIRAKTYPQALLKGYDIHLAAHVHPPVGTLSAIVKSAGGNVIHGLDQVKDYSKTIFVACEEDMDEALSAVKKGIWTFSSDWFMSCIMKQELDLGAPQFAESL